MIKNTKRFCVKLLFLVVVIPLLTSGFKPYDKSGIGKYLPGKWYGEDSVSTTGVLRTWIQKRKRNGNYVVKFRELSEGKIYRSKVKGFWWYQDGCFYEICPRFSKVPDRYAVIPLNKNEIKFELISADVLSSIYGTNYAFIDRRVGLFRKRK